MTSRTLRLSRYLVRVADVQGRIRGILSKPQFQDVNPLFLEDLASVDPTGNKGDYLNWIFKNVNLKDQAKKITWPEDKERTRQALQFFHALKPSERDYNKISRDINQFDLRSLEAARRQVHGHPDLPSFSGGSLPEGSSFYAHEGRFEIVKVGGPGVDLKLAMQAACTLGQGTEWCTRDGAEAAKSHLQRGPLFVIYKDEVPYAQFQRDKDDDAELRDVGDNEIGMVQDPVLYELLLKLNLMPRSMYSFESVVLEGRKRGPSLKVWHERGTPEQEKEIAISPRYSFEYAERVLRKQPFPLGESAIAKIGYYAYRYAWEILGVPFPLGEPSIAKDPDYSYNYASHVLDQKPFPLGEPAISRDPKYSYYYSRFILHGRFLRGEPAISTDSDYSYNYALYVLDEGPFPMGEPAIAKDQAIAAYYAYHILKDPDPTTWGQRYLSQHGLSA